MSTSDETTLCRWCGKPGKVAIRTLSLVQYRRWTDDNGLQRSMLTRNKQEVPFHERCYNHYKAAKERGA